MELYQLRTFVAVAREQHLTRAAERLSISQPAVSGQLKALEHELGLTLFERRSGGMQLTRAGAALLGYAEAALAAAQEFASQAKRLSGTVAGKLRIGVILQPDAIRLGALTNHLLSRHPSLDIDIRHRNTLTLVPSLRSLDLDASFSIGLEVPSDLRAIPLRRLTYRIAAAPAWRDRLRGTDWPALARLPWVTTPPSGAIFRMTDAMFRARGLQLASPIEADQESAIVGLVESGVGLCLMREELALEAARRGRLLVWGEERAESTLRLLFLASRETEPLIAALSEAVAQVWSQPGEAVAADGPVDDAPPAGASAGAPAGARPVPLAAVRTGRGR